MIQKINNDLKLLKEYDLKIDYKNGLGFICSSPYFLDFYFIIVTFDNGYQIRTYRNGLLEYAYKEKEYFKYNLIKDIILLLNEQIEYEFK